MIPTDGNLDDPNFVGMDLLPKISFESVLLNERVAAKVVQRLLNFFFCSHHERTIARDRFVQRFSGNQQKADGLLSSDNLDMVVIPPNKKFRSRNLCFAAVDPAEIRRGAYELAVALDKESAQRKTGKI